MPTCPFCNESNPAEIGVCKKCGGTIPKEESAEGDLTDLEKEILGLMKGQKKIEAIKLLSRENRPGIEGSEGRRRGIGGEIWDREQRRRLRERDFGADVCPLHPGGWFELLYAKRF